MEFDIASVGKGIVHLLLEQLLKMGYQFLCVCCRAIVYGNVLDADLQHGIYRGTCHASCTDDEPPSRLSYGVGWGQSAPNAGSNSDPVRVLAVQSEDRTSSVDAGQKSRTRWDGAVWPELADGDESVGGPYGSRMGTEIFGQSRHFHFEGQAYRCSAE